MINPLDQFDVEPTVFYSGTYVDPIFRGSVLTRNRRVVASHASGSNEILSAQTYSEYFELSGSQRRRKLGMGQRFVRLSTTTERYFDSLLPDILSIYQLNGGQLILASAEFGVAPILQTTADAGFTTSAVTKIVFVTTGVTASLSGTSTPIGDRTWFGSFPFQQTYSGLTRQVNPTFYRPQVPTPLSESNDPVSGVVVYASNSNTFKTSSLATVELVLPNFSLTGLVGNAAREPLRITMLDVTGSVTSSTEAFLGNGTNPFPPTGSGLFGVTKGTTRPALNEILKFFFGFGDFYQRTPLLTATTSSFFYSGSGVINGYYATNAEIRGWRYGIVNGFPQYSSCVFRTNRYGQFRDMLEQRPFTKWFDPEGVTFDGRATGKKGVKEPSIQVTFLSGTNASITSSSPTLNPHDSGIYDFECKAGQPFVDV